MSKVPCGGFKLDNNFLGMNENDELSLAGGGEGKAYQQIVTDGEGTVKWEDRLAYDDSRIVVDTPADASFVYITDEIPDEKMQQGEPCTVSFNKGSTHSTIINSRVPDTIYSAEGVIFILMDNVEYAGVVWPKRGVYFMYNAEYDAYVTRIFFDVSTKIVWDGKVENVKTIDPKYIPNTDVFFVLSGSSFRTGTDWDAGEDATIADIVSAYHDGGARIFQMSSGECIGISNVIGASASGSSSPFITYYDYASKTVFTKS